jgi:prepilin-type N-terminal cleavage/methylation domain-containing protein
MTAMRNVRYTRGFTVIELLIGMLITSILLSAVAAFAYALTVGSMASGDVAAKQAQLRQTTLRLCDLVGCSKLLCAASSSDLVLWKGDANHNNLIDVNEVAYIEFDGSQNALRLLEFSVAGGPTVLAALGLPSTEPVLTTLRQPQTKPALVQQYQSVNNAVREVALLQGCSNVVFTPDQYPPYTRRLTISFDLTDSNGPHHYEIVVALRASAQNLLSTDGNTLVSDDD